MNDFDCCSFVGKYYGEIEVAKFLSSVAITMTPRVPRDEHWTILVNENLGIELTFTKATYFGTLPREYPQDALLLSNILFHGTKTSLHRKCQLALPKQLSFDMSKMDVLALLGKPELDSMRISTCRWDYPDHCLSITRDRDDFITRVSIGMPV